MAMGCSMKKPRPVSDHFNGDVFFNPTMPNFESGLGSVFKMLIEGGRAEWPREVRNLAKPKLDHELGPDDVAITWVNHASFLIQVPGLNILTDPVWSKRASPVSFAGPARVREPGIAFDDLPKIDVVLVSHNHYDHFDVETLKRLNEKFSPKIFVAAGDGDLAEEIGYKNPQECDWWDSFELSKTVTIVYAPTQHFAARGIFDRFHSLWGSYMIESNGHRIYFGGDAGYSAHYKEIEKRLGAPDVALIGIGAYEPNWFMKPMHMNPSEAVQAHQDLKSKRSIGMHFGTFQLSNEGLDQPPKDLKDALAKAAIPESQFTTMENGETRLFSFKR